MFAVVLVLVVVSQARASLCQALTNDNVLFCRQPGIARLDSRQMSDSEFDRGGRHGSMSMSSSLPGSLGEFDVLYSLAAHLLFSRRIVRSLLLCVPWCCLLLFAA